MILSKGWGFCHENCGDAKGQAEIWQHELKKVQLTVLPDKLCAKFGKVTEQEDLMMVVNTRIELCGAFINSMNMTVVTNKKGYEQMSRILICPK